MAVTIRDIADRVGVSPSTVSRAINGTATISQETKEKIFRAIEELDYHPNSLAKNFASGSTNAIGLVIDANDESTFSNNFFNRSVFAIETVIQKEGYDLMITNDRNNNKYSSVESLVLERKVDGLIIPSSSASLKLIKFFNSHNFPFIVLGEPEKIKTEASWVDINNSLGSQMAVEHLFNNEFKNVALILENDTTLFAKNRISGYKSAIEDQGYEFINGLVADCKGDVQKAFEVTINLLNQVVKPDAFLCSNNEIAFYVLRALKQEGLSVPNDVGVMTFDNYPFSEYMDPPLSVVDVDTFRLGEQAATSLLNKIKNSDSENEQIMISTKLILRESTNRIIQK